MKTKAVKPAAKFAQWLAEAPHIGAKEVIAVPVIIELGREDWCLLAQAAVVHGDGIAGAIVHLIQSEDELVEWANQNFAIDDETAPEKAADPGDTPPDRIQFN